MKTPPWYVLTGGPCAGKTTLVFELEKLGHAVLPEAARMFIEEQLALGKTIPEMRKDINKFEHDILQRHIELEGNVAKDKVTFFDRGIPDNVAYFRFTNLPIDEEFRRILETTKYRKVFLLEMLEYANDTARFETPEEARHIHNEIRRAYEELGHTIVDVPVLPIPERVEFVLANL
ncbi:MAG TPA: ATP-binding protein [Candidatus Paceibacterota bacterium]|nr:ATP-binding protein [Candidatus Paceibacterota bacterium]